MKIEPHRAERKGQGHWSKGGCVSQVKGPMFNAVEAQRWSGDESEDRSLRLFKKVLMSKLPGIDCAALCSMPSARVY
jgi:hypothetical protein